MRRRLTDERGEFVAESLARQDPSLPLVVRYSNVAVGATAADFVGVSVGFSPSASAVTSSFGSSLDAQRADEAQFDLGEGPTVDAVASFVPIVVGDVVSGESLTRWPLAAPALSATGIRSAFSFPLRVGGAQIGALTAYRRTQGDISPSHYANGLVVSSLLTIAILDEQAGASQTEGSNPDPLSISDARVHFAAGMVAEQLDISIVEALVRLRGHAFVSGLTTREVAEQVISRTVVIEK